MDGPFVKSIFVANDSATSESVREYIDPRVPTSTQPLAYFGALDGVATSATETCELWLGPCGTQYYHIHPTDDAKWQAYTGGNPIARKSAPGRVYIVFTTAQQDWVNLALRSALRYFPSARRYGVGVTLAEGRANPYLDEMDAAARAEAAVIESLPGKKQTLSAIDVAFDHRFMAKLALGLAYNIFGPAFATSSYADSLRGQMWGKTHDERAKFNLRGVNFLDGAKDPTSLFIAFDGGYTIRIMAIKDELVLSVHLPSSRVMHIVMADDPSLWSDDRFQSYKLGTVFVVVPQVERFAGPFKLTDYIGYKTSRVSLPALDSIVALKINKATLPSCDEPSV